MKTDMLHRNDTASSPASEHAPTTPKPPQRDLMIGKALAIISVFVLGAVAIELFYNSVVERIEVERSVSYPSHFMSSAYAADFWKIFILHAR
ncbi:hypothetical protein [Noviherbaspirillum saxi]|nr:hypothetical protein [Noviherbaspirillum saxi]